MRDNHTGDAMLRIFSILIILGLVPGTGAAESLAPSVLVAKKKRKKKRK